MHWYEDCKRTSNCRRLMAEKQLQVLHHPSSVFSPRMDAHHDQLHRRTAMMLLRGGNVKTAMSASMYLTGKTANCGKNAALPSALTAASMMPANPLPGPPAGEFQSSVLHVRHSSAGGLSAQAKGKPITIQRPPQRRRPYVHPECVERDLHRVMCARSELARAAQPSFLAILPSASLLGI